MSNDANDRSVRPGGTARYASWGAGLLLLGLGGRFYYERPHEDSPEQILAMARSRGLVPLQPRPALGTPIYQWDAEIPDVAPYRIGPVIKTEVRMGSRVLTEIQQTKLTRLLIDIKPGEMRYWVLK